MKKFLKNNWYVILIIAIVLSCRLFGFFGINYVSGYSMNNTLNDGQLTASSSIPKYLGKLKRGDIVTAYADYTNVIKRIVGLPGETVEQKDGIIYIDGKKYDEPYLEDSLTKKSKQEDWSFTLKEDEYLILGDNRDNSFDSRNFGPVKGTQIKAIVFWY